MTDFKPLPAFVVRCDQLLPGQTILNYGKPVKISIINPSETDEGVVVCLDECGKFIGAFIHDELIAVLQPGKLQ